MTSYITCTGCGGLLVAVPREDGEVLVSLTCKCGARYKMHPEDWEKTRRP